MSPVACPSNVAKAVRRSNLLASTLEHHVFFGGPEMFFTASFHALPPSSVTSTFPSSVPTQMIFLSSGDSQIVNIVQWFSAAELSTVTPPDWNCLCFMGSSVVRSGEIFSHDSPLS